MKKIDNRYQFGVFLIDHWIKVMILLTLIGGIVFILQIRSFQCGDTKIVKQPLDTKIKK